MKQTWERFVLRFPPPLRRRVDEAAKYYRRSVNAEIIMRLDHSLNGIPKLSFERAIEPPMFELIEKSLRANLTDEEQRLVLGYRRLSSTQRRALLDLLVG